MIRGLSCEAEKKIEVRAWEYIFGRDRERGGLKRESSYFSRAINGNGER